MLFLKQDKERSEKELDCYGYCLDQGIVHFLNTEFGKAAAYHENIARSLWELQRMKNSKEMDDQAWMMLKQIEAQQQQEELLNKLRSRL
ncbi:hypothetical protein GCM10011409_43260 [Lentibacillus populi]|uniref:Uncharacterized protein n=1 Tax=Lentibacillus populi TaxID=1827502 RepID=A0A9W5U1U5_9BACI|nr:hypothetical protein [Lentibacillus populi]GGB61356.1 hypothetical protein GCM10011409_43260 [Lentibacillus populi]